MRDLVFRELVKFEKLHLDYNPANMGTKVLPPIKFRSRFTLLNLSKGL